MRRALAFTPRRYRNTFLVYFPRTLFFGSAPSISPSALPCSRAGLQAHPSRGICPGHHSQPHRQPRHSCHAAGGVRLCGHALARHLQVVAGGPQSSSSAQLSSGGLDAVRCVGEAAALDGAERRYASWFGGCSTRAIVYALPLESQRVIIGFFLSTHPQPCHFAPRSARDTLSLCLSFREPSA